MRIRTAAILFSVIAITTALSITFANLTFTDAILPMSGDLNGKTDSPTPKDVVTITVRDHLGNVKYEEMTHNIITTSGAVWYCIESDACQSQITTNPSAITQVSSPTYWIQFVTGTANTNEPTGNDCSVSAGSLSGVTSGSGATLRCTTGFGTSPNQYNSGGSIQAVGAAHLTQIGGVQDTTNNAVESTVETTCSLGGGTGGASGTCAYTITSPTETNSGAGAITVNGISLLSGTSSSTTAGPIYVAEAVLSNPPTLQVGDTVTVTWTITI